MVCVGISKNSLIPCWISLWFHQVLSFLLALFPAIILTKLHSLASPNSSQQKCISIFVSRFISMAMSSDPMTDFVFDQPPFQNLLNSMRMSGDLRNMCQLPYPIFMQDNVLRSLMNFLCCHSNGLVIWCSVIFRFKGKT